MAGVTLADLRTAIAPVDPGCRIVRTMPNTPMKVREGGGVKSKTGGGGASRHLFAAWIQES
jgi:pyrroline-5-carboxylate reductase